VAGDAVSLHTLQGAEGLRNGETTYRRHGNWTVRALAWSPDGRWIAGADTDRPSGSRGASGRSRRTCLLPQSKGSDAPGRARVTPCAGESSYLTGGCLIMLEYARESSIG